MNEKNLLSITALQKYYKVLVRCYTYNHSKYIKDALNGFSMQKTSFPYVCLIVDDSSNDGEQDVIKDWINHECNLDSIEFIDIPISNIFIASHKNNSHCTFVFYLLKENLYNNSAKKDSLVYPWRKKCKYEALCEGDDFWIDSNKLQKQVDFLDYNPEYGLCYTNFNILYQKYGTLKKSLFTTNSKQYPQSYSLEDFIFYGGYLCPASWLYRISLLPVPNINSLDGSFVMFSYFLGVSKTHLILDVTSTYRYLEESASHSNNYSKIYARMQSLLDTQLELIEYFKLSNDFKEKCIKKYYLRCLPQFVINNKQADIKEAKNVLVKPSIKEKILFTLNCPLGRLVLKNIYKMMIMYRNYKKKTI